MSYARFGWDSSDVYIFGTGAEGNHSIECCGCLLNGEWNYRTYGEVLQHLNEHRAANHHVPDYVDERLREEIANSDEQWIPVGVLPEVMVPDPGPQHPEPEAMRRAKVLMAEVTEPGTRMSS